MTSSPEETALGLLGQTVTRYPQQYDPKHLHRILRAPKRSTLSYLPPYPFDGVDPWNAYELSWLSPSGKPEIAVISLEIPCHSPYLIESKSLKLYLNSFNQTQFESMGVVMDHIKQDISDATQATIALNVFDIEQARPCHKLPGNCLDKQNISCTDYQPIPECLATTSANIHHETVYSHLFRSNCPVTGQPDWATVWIDYSGAALCHDHLLKYLISYRNHNDLHEHCVERIFCDLLQYAEVETLSVMAYFTRRGGIDINPYRSNVTPRPTQHHRLYRQ